ncbi:MAG: hypothetical protein MH825_16075 [Cyanobacteria bacterium]|nr:hypothetical protein [Cyanobacteriota bacterium]
MGATDHFSAGGNSGGRMPSFHYWQESKHLWAPRWQEVAGDQSEGDFPSPAAPGAGDTRGNRVPPPSPSPGQIFVRVFSVLTGLVAMIVYIWALGLAWQGTHGMADRWFGELSQTAGRPLP